jgi:hypothetical protein
LVKFKSDLKNVIGSRSTYALRLFEGSIYNKEGARERRDKGFIVLTSLDS